jgi:tRNA pseudouridine38-40 synthase
MTDATISGKFYQPEENDPTIRVALLVEYCGLDFRGSQFQLGQPTVQDSLQRALKQLNLKTSAVSFASRTDAGVHALGQVAHFDISLDALANVPNLASALNAVLPESIAVRDVQHGVGRLFHSRRDAAAKWYRYKIYNSVNRSVWAQQNGATLYRAALDADLMNQAARLLLGEHEFTSFKDLGSNVVNDFCRLLHANVSRDGEFIILDVAANRFLYKMVRNIVGQLMVIGKASNLQPPETILKVLSERDRRKASQAAPAEGLALMAVHYIAPFNLFEKDVYVQQFKNILKPMESLQNENLFRKAS